MEWGIPDFLNFCEAAGFLGVPDFNINETPQDMADFMQYVNGPTNTVWGAQRAADGHPSPYGLKYLELGNEERVDSNYYAKFQALAQAIWSADANVTLVAGDFTYSEVITNSLDFKGAASGITNLAGQAAILALAKTHGRAVWFDVHVWTDGPYEDPSLRAMFSYDSALEQVSGGADYKVVVFELNANNHNQGRALGNALAIGAAERDGRLPIVTSANCLQPDGENDNSWDQGLLFLNPRQVWLQPPGYVTQMLSHNYLPQEVESEVEQSGSSRLAVDARLSEDGKELVLDAINPGGEAEPVSVVLNGYLPDQSLATVEELAGPLNTVNSADDPQMIHVHQRQEQFQLKDGVVKYLLPPYSVTIIHFN